MNANLAKLLSRQGLVWLLGGIVGAVAGLATLGFRSAILGVQNLAFGEPEERLASAAAELPFFWVTLAPVLGGIVVGFLLWLAQKTGHGEELRASGVADVIEARALRNGRINPVQGLYTAAISAITLGSGGSAGREGPAVHLGATLAAWIANTLRLQTRDVRTLLACGVAAAVAASFNAPLAGMLFALEVVLGHYALRVMAPTAFAATIGALITRHFLGAQPAFLIPPIDAVSPAVFPAAIALGILCAGVAVLFSKLVLAGPGMVQRSADRFHFPLWALPPVGGLIVGLIGTGIPEILGVGYEATTGALAGRFSMLALIVLVLAKVLATAVTLSFRSGGGVFSPSLFLGAMTGSLFGLMVTQWFGMDMASIPFFAVVGMGALSGAVLGAPISTTLIVFELTGSYEASLAVLLAVSIATAISNSILGANIFHKQIEKRGYDLKDGPGRLILQMIRVREFMIPLASGEQRAYPYALSVFEDDTLGRTLGLMDAEDAAELPVKSRANEQPVIGYVTKQDALIAYNRKLVEEHDERHN